MTTQDLRARVVAQARSWLDAEIKEADGSHMEIIGVYNAIRPLPRGYAMTSTDPWCAAFVSAVGAACGLGDVIFPECACDPMIAAYKATGRWVEDDGYLPTPGDVIFYDWQDDWQDDGRGDNRGSSDHVGLVVAVEGSTITVVEGNKSDAVGTRTLQRDGRYIRGFAVPDYESAADMSGGATPQSPAATAPLTQGSQAAQGSQTREMCVIMVFVLRYGDGLNHPDNTVRSAQILLIGHGYVNELGSGGADGEFGRCTEGAVKKFQRAWGLKPDGVIGAETWAALLGVAKN